MSTTGGPRRIPPRRHAEHRPELPGATLFKQLLSIPVAGAVALLLSSVVRRGGVPGGPLRVIAAGLFLGGFAIAWLWASSAWRRLLDWRLRLAMPLFGSSAVLAVLGTPSTEACVPVRTYRVGVTPADVAIADDAAWVTDWQQSPSRLYRVALSGASSVDEVALTGAFEVAGDTSRLWVSSDRAAELSEVDPRSRRVLSTVALPGRAADIAATTTDVWMTFPDQLAVGRLERGSKHLDVFALDTSPLSLAVDGPHVWVTGADGALHDVDRTTGRTVSSLPVGKQPYGVFGADGAAWVAVTGEDVIVRYDAVTRGTRRFRVAGAPSDLVVHDGRLWVASQDAGTVTVIDARTAELVRVFAVGGGPLKLERAGTSLFVTNPGTAEVHRINTGCVAP